MASAPVVLSIKTQGKAEDLLNESTEERLSN